MGERAGDRGGHDLVGLGRDGDRRRDADEMSSGVIRNPPPTPNNPERKPTPPPNPKSSATLTETSAMGR